MTTQKTIDFPIVGGPGKFDIMVSLFEGNPENRHTVEFTLETTYGPNPLTTKLKVAVTGVQQEDGSGESWNISGWVSNGPRAHFKCYYSSRNRHGNFSFIIPTKQRIDMDKGVITEVDQNGKTLLEQGIKIMKA